jgi:pimeloyl-ACP methyl ester carboxylesterase
MIIAVQVLLASGLFALAVMAASICAAAIERRRFSPPGQRVRINGHSLHARVIGRGSPVVIFESGLPGTVLSWSAVQQRLAERTATLSYDRAGLGWSDPGPEPRTAGRIVEELHRLLQALQLPPPYVLVGHSYGGLIVRLYAARYPADVAGLVLLDPTMPEEWYPPSEQTQRLLAAGVRVCRRGALLCRLGLARWIAWLFKMGAARAAQKTLTVASRGFLADALRVVGPVFLLPPEQRAAIHWFWQQARFYRTLASQIETLPQSASQVLEAEQEQSSHAPLLVLTTPTTPASRRWAQQRLTDRWPEARLREVPAGHWIQLEKPEAVLEAITHLLDASAAAGPGSV